MIYLLTAIGLTPGDSSTYTFTHKQYTEQHNETEYIAKHNNLQCTVKITSNLFHFVNTDCRHCSYDNVQVML